MILQIKREIVAFTIYIRVLKVGAGFNVVPSFCRWLSGLLSPHLRLKLDSGQPALPSTWEGLRK